MHPVLKVTVSALLEALPKADSIMRKVLPFPQQPYDLVPSPDVQQLPAWYMVLAIRSYIMATINANPDSFFGAGQHMQLSPAMEFATTMKEAGADIIDIGAYSARPDADFVDAKEEERRAVPVVKHLRDSGIGIPISIDTFRGNVAEACIRAGANCINDIEALTGDDEILGVALRTGVPVIMMHSRGNSAENENYEPLYPGQKYEETLMETIYLELGAKVQRALNAGIRRWNIVLDPGIGFSKNVRGNLEILRNFAKFTAKAPFKGFPTLVAPSNKAFLGEVLGRPDASPTSRIYGTAATCAIGVQQGGDIMRVHDVAAIRDVLKVADAVYRS